MSFLIPCILVILCELPAYLHIYHMYAIDFFALFINGISTLFLAGVIVSSVVILIKKGLKKKMVIPKNNIE